jgi:hypothetical protein
MSQKIRDFEARVWIVDGVRLVGRGNPEQGCGFYDYDGEALGTLCVEAWLRERVLPKLAESQHGGPYEVTVLAGDGEQPHPETLLRTVRASYGPNGQGK